MFIFKFQSFENDTTKMRRKAALSTYRQIAETTIEPKNFTLKTVEDVILIIDFTLWPIPVKDGKTNVKIPLSDIRIARRI